MANGSDREIVVDLIQYLIKNTIHIQDWPRVMVFRKANDDLLHQYCYKRFPDGDEKLLWNICNMENGCEDCKEILEELKKRFSEDSPKIGEQYFHKLKLSEIFDHKILPSIEDSDIARYPNYFLFFEFPAATIFPKTTSGKSNGVKKLGDHYISKLTPIFDRLLMKRKILKHSVRAAVSAIISRNHSHHIGSHVTPRTNVSDLQKRLKGLGYVSESDSKDSALLLLDCIDSLKSRLDEYIQKKADFMAEIATEPLTTTISKFLFKDVLLYFIRNSLLMDNIGANEGVKYIKTDDGSFENRLRINFLFNGRCSKLKLKKDLCDFNNTNIPYMNKDLEFKGIEGNDIAVAWPGPLGEFALYSFLENFIRNAVKHNFDIFRKDKKQFLDIFINVSDLLDNDKEKNEYYKIEVWDNITTSDGLLNRLDAAIKESIVETDGRLKKGAWGIAEMKIMATLMRGSNDFSSMESSLTVKSCEKEKVKRLVYEFRLMKPKEIAIVSRGHECWNINKKNEDKKSGVWWFSSLEEFKQSQSYGSSPSAFNIAILDSESSKERSGYSQLLPYRLLISGDNQRDSSDGAIRVGENFIDCIKEKKAEEITSASWREWASGLLKAADQDEHYLSIFFGRKDNDPVTNVWRKLSKVRQKEKCDIPKLAIIYGKGNGFTIDPDSAKIKSRHFLFDRHFKGWRVLKHPKEMIDFHEVFDKSSSDFIPIFSSEPTDMTVSQLVESACLKILIIDERVAEIAHKDMLAGEPDDLYASKKRLYVAKYANVFIATHLVINNNGLGPLPIHDTAKAQFPRVCVKLETEKNSEIKSLKVYWCETCTTDDCRSCPKDNPIKIDAIIIHQGVSESLLKETILDGRPEENFKEYLGAFLGDLKKHIPYLIVDSGRGIPANLPDDAKFIPFSLIEDYLMKDRISKFSLTKVLMGVTRRRNN